jgi:hypothetical protein
MPSRVLLALEANSDTGYRLRQPPPEISENRFHTPGLGPSAGAPEPMRARVRS